MRFRPVLFCAALTLLLYTPAMAELTPKPVAPPARMESYQLVLLRRGPAWTPPVTPDSERIQREHIAHLQKMGTAGKLLVAGPFDEQTDQALRGMCLYRVESLEEARRLAEADPAVQAGRLRVEVMSWWVEKGALAFPRATPGGPPVLHHSR